MIAFVRTFLATLLATLLGLLIILLILAGLLAFKFNRKAGIDDHSWLHLDLYGEGHEYDPPGDLMSRVTGGGGALTLQMILENLPWRGVFTAACDGRRTSRWIVLGEGRSGWWIRRCGLEDEIARLRNAAPEARDFRGRLCWQGYHTLPEPSSFLAPDHKPA